MNSAFSRSSAAALAAALLATLPLASPAKPAAAILPIDWTLEPGTNRLVVRGLDRDRRSAAPTRSSAPRGRRTFAGVVAAARNLVGRLQRRPGRAGLPLQRLDRRRRPGGLAEVLDRRRQRAQPRSARGRTSTGRSPPRRPSGTARGAAQLKLTALWLTALKRSGAGLPDAQRREFVALQQKLTDAQNKFQANLGNDDVVDRDQRRAGAIAAAGLRRRVAQEGRRRRLHRAGQRVDDRAVPAERDRRDRAQGVLHRVQQPRRRRERRAARRPRSRRATASRTWWAIPTWAAFVLADRMAGSPQRVESFLAQIDTAILPKARQERDEDAALAKADGRTTFDQWDQTYYENQLQKTKYAVDQNEIKQYFPVQHVVDSVLGDLPRAARRQVRARQRRRCGSRRCRPTTSPTRRRASRSDASTSTSSRAPASTTTSRTSRSCRAACCPTAACGWPRARSSATGRSPRRARRRCCSTATSRRSSTSSATAWRRCSPTNRTRR